jgi:hypothetical protein
VKVASNTKCGDLPVASNTKRGDLPLAAALFIGEVKRDHYRAANSPFHVLRTSHLPDTTR